MVWFGPRKLRGLIGKVDQLSTSCQTILNGPDYEMAQQKTKLEVFIRSELLSRTFKSCLTFIWACRVELL